jgi:hypothetical protein
VVEKRVSCRDGSSPQTDRRLPCTGSDFYCQQLAFLERYQIMAFLQPGRPQTEISGTLNCSKGKIYVKFVAILLKGNLLPALLRSQ